jgi:hypothetical protein
MEAIEQVCMSMISLDMKGKEFNLMCALLSGASFKPIVVPGKLVLLLKMQSKAFVLEI